MTRWLITIGSENLVQRESVKFLPYAFEVSFFATGSGNIWFKIRSLTKFAVEEVLMSTDGVDRNPQGNDRATLIAGIHIVEGGILILVPDSFKVFLILYRLDLSNARYGALVAPRYTDIVTFCSIVGATTVNDLAMDSLRAELYYLLFPTAYIHMHQP